MRTQFSSSRCAVSAALHSSASSSPNPVRVWCSSASSSSVAVPASTPMRVRKTPPPARRRARRAHAPLQLPPGRVHAVEHRPQRHRPPTALFDTVGATVLGADPSFNAVMRSPLQPSGRNPATRDSRGTGSGTRGLPMASTSTRKGGHDPHERGPKGCDQRFHVYEASATAGVNRSTVLRFTPAG